MRDHAGKVSRFELVLEVWDRRRWLAVVVFGLVFAGTAGIATFLPNIYRSTAVVLVERAQVPETFVRSSVTGELETRLQTIGQKILSRARLEDVITRFGLYSDLRGRAPIETVAEKMRRDVQVELKGVDPMIGRSAIVAFNLSYQGRDPETVAKVTNALASFYVEENSKLREGQASHTSQFLRVQVEETKRRLDEQETRVRDFRARHIGELPQQIGVNLATLQRIETQLHLNGANQLRVMDQRAALVKPLAESDAAGAPDALTARTDKLKQELLELRTRFSDKYPDVIRVQAEIAALERKLAGETPDGSPATDATATRAGRSVPPWKAALNQIDAEIKSLKAEEQRLRHDMNTYQRRLENAPQREQEFKEMSRDFETMKELYSSLSKRYEDAQLAESMEQSRQGEQFQILDPAIPAKQPMAPNWIGLILVGVVLSLGAAGSAVMLAEHLDTSFYTLDDLRAFTNVPVMASIPRIVRPTDTARRARQRRLATASIALGLMLVVMASYRLAHGNDQLVRMLSRTVSSPRAAQ